MGHVMCPVTLPCLKLRALAGRSLSVFLSLSIQAVAYLPVEYSSGARNGDRYGKEAENAQRTWLCELFCFALLFFRSAPQNFPPKKILSRRNIASIIFGHSEEDPLTSIFCILRHPSRFITVFWDIEERLSPLNGASVILSGKGENRERKMF